MIFALMTATAVLSFLICGLIRWLPLRDAPDGGRKQQAAPVPTSGGLGILLAAVICTLLAPLLVGDVDALAWNRIPGSFGLCALILIPFLIGLVDDWRGMPALLKLGLILAWIAVVLTGAVSQAESLSPGSIAIFSLIGVFCLVFVNAANFMDGSNGLAVGCLALMIASLGAIALGHWDYRIPTSTLAQKASIFAVLIFAASIGFLIWNMAGKLYAGDAGAIGLGGLFCLIAILLYLTVPRRMAVIWYVLTVSLPFTVDVLLTLALRTWQRKNILRAHTDHAYQRLRAAGWAHWKVALLWWGMTLVCILVAVFGVMEAHYATGSEAPGRIGIILFFATATCGGLLWIAHRLAHMRGPNAAA